jgi:hypothetical protein
MPAGAAAAAGMAAAGAGEDDEAVEAAEGGHKCQRPAWASGGAAAAVEGEGEGGGPEVVGAAWRISRWAGRHWWGQRPWSRARRTAPS